MKQQQKLIPCTKCNLAYPEEEYENSNWDKPDHTRCKDCRRADNTEYARRYRAKKKQQKINTTNSNLDSFLMPLILNHIVHMGQLSCANCGYNKSQAIDLIDPHNDIILIDKIQIYLFLPTIDAWAEVVKAIPYLIPICANCNRLSKSGYINTLDLEYHYTQQQLDNIQQYNN